MGVTPTRTWGSSHLSHTAPTQRYAMKRSVAELYQDAGIWEMLPDERKSAGSGQHLVLRCDLDTGLDELVWMPDAEKEVCAATVLDSESEPEQTVADSESTNQSQESEVDSDDLCVMWEKKHVVETPLSTPCDSDSFDSQLSANEDPNVEPNCVQSPPDSNAKQWTEDPKFWERVEDVLAVCLPYDWFSNDFFWDAPPLFAANKMASANFIRELLSGGQVRKFKIGITEHPWQRWKLYKAERKFERFRTMHILYAAKTSKWKITPYDSDRRKELKSTSTGAMEINLVAEFEGYPECVNRPGSGGECASDGSPHFVYVVVC